jgi:hypothetical protein
MPVYSRHFTRRSPSEDEDDIVPAIPLDPEDRSNPAGSRAHLGSAGGPRDRRSTLPESGLRDRRRGDPVDFLMENPLDYPTDLLYRLSVAAILPIYLIYRSVRVVPKEQKLAIVRLGRFIGTRGPGIVMIFPICERAIRINLDQDVPHWRALSAEQLEQEIERRVTAS